jgi:aspartyl-tRNA(Asn)/glutamyl-tRNA(Gln) amidotransferase subunit B
MRSKEGAKDYRFFPDPDLPPLVVDMAHIEAIAADLPELPHVLQDRLCTQYDLSVYESSVLVQEPFAAVFFEEIASTSSRPSKMVVNWVLNDLFGLLKATNQTIQQSPVDSKRLGALLDLIVDGTISGKIAKDVLEIMFYEEFTKSPLEIVQAKNWQQIQDPQTIQQLCDQVIHDKKNLKNLEAYAKGKQQIFGFFIGQLMKISDGKVHPECANQMMQQRLDEKVKGIFKEEDPFN